MFFVIKYDIGYLWAEEFGATRAADYKSTGWLVEVVLAVRRKGCEQFEKSWVSVEPVPICGAAIRMVQPDRADGRCAHPGIPNGLSAPA